jgi:hypothetical protein
LRKKLITQGPTCAPRCGQDSDFNVVLPHNANRWCRVSISPQDAPFDPAAKCFLDETVRRERRRGRFAHWRVAALLACTFVLFDGPSIHSGTAVALGPEPSQSRVAAFARPQLDSVTAALKLELDLRRLAFASADAFAVSELQEPRAAITVAAAAGQ